MFFYINTSKELGACLAASLGEGLFKVLIFDLRLGYVSHEMLCVQLSEEGAARGRSH